MVTDKSTDLTIVTERRENYMSSNTNTFWKQRWEIVESLLIALLFSGEGRSKINSSGIVVIGFKREKGVELVI